MEPTATMMPLLHADQDDAPSSEDPARSTPVPSSPSALRAVEVSDRAGALGAAGSAWLRDALVRALTHLDAAGEVRISVVGDAGMAAAHAAYLGDSTTTDVITFDLRDGAHGPIDADILICIDEATRNAADRGHTVERELLLYALHGVLHCLGHDDHDPEAFDAMHAREDEVLRAIGIGPTFGSEAGAPGDGGGEGAAR